MNTFIEIPSDFLANIADDSDRIPRLYYASNYVLRRIFWQRLYRLHWLMNRHVDARDRCLDFGGGSGVLLPTLSVAFSHVTLVDLETHQAEMVRQRYGVINATILQSDMSAVDFSQTPFDVAIAADVLEHFPDLGFPIGILRSWIKQGGMLFTSLPTENYVYVFLRKVFAIQKPLDHYHAADEVERHLSRDGFQKIATSCVPLHVRVAPLFLITAWRRDDSY